MSDTENMQTPDISKIVGLIMENPRIIDEISSLMKKSDGQSEPEENGKTAKETSSVQEAAVNTSDPSERSARRTRLLGALKPYVSKERARAIDSMISISEMLDVMKAR